MTANFSTLLLLAVPVTTTFLSRESMVFNETCYKLFITIIFTNVNIIIVIDFVIQY